MTDFLSKPLQMDQLKAALSRALDRRQATRNVPPALENAPDANAPLRERILECLSGVIETDFTSESAFHRRPERYLSYLKNYEVTYRDTASQLRSHLAAGNADEARRIAHSLRGSSGMLGVVGIQTLATELEDAIANGSVDAAVSSKIAEIENRIAVVFTAIRQLDAV